MAALSDVVSVSTTVAAASPTQPGFGVPLIAAQKCPAGFTNRVRSYSSLAAMVTDGFATTHPAYIAVGKALAQNPAPPSVKVGRRALGSTWTVKLLLGSTNSGDVYSVTLVNLLTGTSTTVTRTSTGVPATDATALAASIAAVSGFSASASTATITITATGGVGVLHQVKNWTVNGARSGNLYLTNTTADPGIATDLNAIIAEDNTWYGLTLDNESNAEIAAAAAWAETNKKLNVFGSAESNVPDSTETTTNIFSVVKAAAYTYSGGLYNGNDTMGFSGLSWQASRFAASPTPGNDTWLFKTLAGVVVDALTETEVATLANKSGTGYCSIQGVNVTFSGGVANNNSGATMGSGMFIDVRRGIDWSQSLIQIGMYTALLNNPKIPYTDKGLGALGNIILGALQKGEQSGLYTAGSSLVNVPLAAAQASGDRAIRKANNLNWQASLAGAVHLVVVVGTAS